MNRAAAGIVVLTACVFQGVVPAFADVSVTDVNAWSATVRGASRQKRVEKKTRQPGAAPTGRVEALAIGSQQLVDSSGLQYFINTNVTFATTSSASGAVSEASYTGPVQATTSAGGTVSMTLSDAFDGYFGLWLSQAATGQPSKGSSAYVSYNRNGPASVDSTCGGRQIVFGNQTIYGLSVARKVYVPSNDTFARWQTVLTNQTAASITVNVLAANNLGSDAGTRIDSTSSGGTTATVADYWVSTYQDYSADGRSSDPRLAHVFWGPGGVGPNAVFFANGNDNPYWSIPVTVPAGQTRIVLHFVTGQPTRAAARAKAAAIARNPLGLAEVACMNTAERSEVVNFVAAGAADLAIPALGWPGVVALVAAIAAMGFLSLRRLA